MIELILTCAVAMAASPVAAAGADPAQPSTRPRAYAPIDITPLADGIGHWRMKEGRDRNDERFDASQIVAIADNMLQYQNADGGWPKDLDWLAKIDPREVRRLRGRALDRSTFDNRNTYTQMEYLAKVYAVAGLPRFRRAAERGFDYILREQRPSGGWRGRDADAITFNDDVMTGIMNRLLDIASSKPHFAWLDPQRRGRARVAFDKAVEATLKCQIVVDGRKTAWCQQHDHQTFEPVGARAYELPSITALESTGVVRLLMRIDPPTPRIVEALETAARWFEQSKINGTRLKRVKIEPQRFKGHTARFDRAVVRDPSAPPIWARFYEVETNRPFFCNRDGVKVYTLAEVHPERRTGYGWYGYWPAAFLAEDYPAWRARLNSASRAPALRGEAGRKPRVVVTTDGERDDQCSMVRFLMYANEWDVRGLVISSSKHHWKGNETTPAFRWPGETWLPRFIAAYAEVYPRLKEHDAGYPAPDYLKRQVFVGNIELKGEMEKETPGSTRIVEVLLDPDPSPVWLQAWGGANTIARALKTIEERHPDRIAAVSEKARLFLITEQDETYADYISKQWPGVQVIVSGSFKAIAYGWRRLLPEHLHRYFNGRWMGTNIAGHGALSSMHPGLNKGKPKFISEGDSPAFMHQIDVGLRSTEHPGYGGWGGRFALRRGCEWRDAKDDGDKLKPLHRWAVAFQNDWAARADWCVKGYGEANHPPIVKPAPALDQTAKPGQRVALSAEGTRDPDGDRLTYRWWQYADAGSCRGTVGIRDSDGPHASFVVPEGTGLGDTIHIICEVTDNGTPPLTRYARVLVTVGR